MSFANNVIKRNLVCFGRRRFRQRFYGVLPKQLLVPVELLERLHQSVPGDRCVKKIFFRPSQVCFTDQCPEIKCKGFASDSFRDCESSDECYRSEVCCRNPCVDKKQCLKKTTAGKGTWHGNNLSRIPALLFLEEFDDLVCPKVTSCSKLVNEYQDPKECADDSECLRKEKCCTHPCDDNAVSDFPDKMCMTGQRQTYYAM